MRDTYTHLCNLSIWTGGSYSGEGWRPGGVPPPPTIMAIARPLLRLLTAAAAPAMPWLPLNVIIIDNDRGASPCSYRVRASRGASSYRLDACKVAAIAWGVMLSDSARNGMAQCYFRPVAWAHALAASTLTEGLPRVAPRAV